MAKNYECENDEKSGDTVTEDKEARLHCLIFFFLIFKAYLINKKFYFKKPKKHNCHRNGNRCGKVLYS